MNPNKLQNRGANATIGDKKIFSKDKEILTGMAQPKSNAT